MAKCSKRNENVPDDLLDQISENGCDLVQTEKEERNLHYINIDGPIIDPDKYRQVYSILRKASLDDLVILILNTAGGLVSTTMQLYNYLLTTNATTIAEIHTAYSGGSVLALACDNIHVAKFGSMMIHSLSAGSSGKMHEIEGQVAFFNQFNDKTLRELYSGFLTEVEIKTVFDGKDIWMMEDDILKRLKNWKPVRQRITENNIKEEKKKVNKTGKIK